MLPCLWVATQHQHSAYRLGQPSKLFGMVNVAGCEPECGGLATSDETMVRDRELRHGPRDRSGHLAEPIGVIARATRSETKCELSSQTGRAESAHFARRPGRSGGVDQLDVADVAPLVDVVGGQDLGAE